MFVKQDVWQRGRRTVSKQQSTAKPATLSSEKQWVSKTLALRMVVFCYRHLVHCYGLLNDYFGKVHVLTSIPPSLWSQDNETDHYISRNKRWNKLLQRVWLFYPDGQTNLWALRLLSNFESFFDSGWTVDSSKEWYWYNSCRTNPWSFFNKNARNSSHWRQKWAFRLYSFSNTIVIHQISHAKMFQHETPTNKQWNGRYLFAETLVVTSNVSVKDIKLLHESRLTNN